MYPKISHLNFVIKNLRIISILKVPPIVLNPSKTSRRTRCIISTSPRDLLYFYTIVNPSLERTYEYLVHLHVFLKFLLL